MRKVFVSGATGFIGQHLVNDLVKREVSVRCLVRPRSETQRIDHPSVEITPGQLDDVEQLRSAISGCDTVFHLAGQTYAVRNEEMYHTNGRLTGLVAEACRKQPNPPRLIFSSSLAAAGPTLRNTVRDESEPPTPISVYGKSKRQGEIEIERRAADVPCTIIRPGAVFGPFDRAILLMFQSVYRYRLHVVAGFRTPPLSLIYVSDLVDLMIRCAVDGECVAASKNDEYSPQGYYVASDDSEFPTLWQLGPRIARACDRRFVFVWPLWRWVARTAAVTNQGFVRLRGKATRFNVDKVNEGCVASWASSAAKARTQLGFNPDADLDSRLRETAEWYLANNWL